MELPGSYGNSIFNFLWNCLTSYIATVSFENPMVVCEGSDFSTFLPTLVTFCVSDRSHPDGCALVSYCNFNLHFPSNQWHGTSFFEAYWPFVYFFGETSNRVLRAFFNRVVCCCC